jgi:hypothetical protein
VKSTYGETQMPNELYQLIEQETNEIEYELTHHACGMSAGVIWKEKDDGNTIDGN